MSATVEVAKYIQYLEIKKAVDDRSLNPRVWGSLAQAVAAHRASQPLRVLELGCGIGTMLERALERGLFGPPAAPGGRVPASPAEQDHEERTAGPAFHQVEYTGVDASAELIDAARRRLPSWSSPMGFELADSDLLRRGELAVHPSWETADAFDFAALPGHPGRYDLLLAHAFLDLVDARRALQAFLPLLRPGGLFYFSVVFDGLTLFQPALDPELDAHVERLYHQDMDQRVVGGLTSGHSQTGRQLLSLLLQAGGEILDVGSSDWVVSPSRGEYRPSEQQFLAFILETIGAALQGNPELAPAELEEWLSRRQAQLGRRELAYVAHQLDFLGAYAPPD